MRGVGLHTGVETRLTFSPAPPGHGVTFVRTDLEHSPEVPADIDHVVDLERGTTIGIGPARINTVEHVLAAIAGLQIDNVIVALDNLEPPVMDGSIKPFVDKLLEGGDRGAERRAGIPGNQDADLLLRTGPRRGPGGAPLRQVAHYLSGGLSESGAGNAVHVAGFAQG